MIRFFTNYSYGGYEELYLGNILDTDEYKYYLPLLPVKKAKLDNNPSDEKLKMEVECLLHYPLIQKHGINLEATLPDGAFTLISNPGYNIICRRIGTQFVVAISNVASEDHDEMGGGQRENPFTMLFVFDEEDTDLMDALLYEIVRKESEWRKLISSLFAYDKKANGLRFSLGVLNQTIKTLETMCVSGIDHKAEVPLIVLEKNFKLSYTMDVQKLDGKTIGTAYDAEGKLLKGADLVSTSMIKPVPDSDSKEKPVPNGDDKEPQPSVDIDSLRKQIEANLRPIIRKEEREKVTNGLRLEYQRKMEEKKMEFITERKKIIFIAIGATIGAFILGALLFK